MVKNSVQKSFIIEQFSIGRSTLYYILKNEEKFKAKNEKLSFYYLLLIEYYTAVILFNEKNIICTYLEKCLSGHV